MKIYLLVLFIARFCMRMANGKGLRLGTEMNFSGDKAFIAPVTCRTHDDVDDGCFPQKCSRVVKDGLFSPEEVEALKTIAMKGYATRESMGGPTILDINTGYIRDSAGVENLFVREGEQRIYTNEDFTAYGSIISRLRQEILDTFDLKELYFTAPTFITRLDGRKSWEPKEIHDQYWHPHADRNNTGHYHYSGLLYLSEYKKDFRGGRFIFYNEDAEIDQVVEPLPGRTVIFTSGHENTHNVERVKKGERLVLAFWFTCDKRREFEIFLDGKQHDAFATKVAASVRMEQERARRQTSRLQGDHGGDGSDL